MIRPKVAAWSDVGRQRDLNEDRVFYQMLESSDLEPTVLSIVADGMGGHLAGEVASHWVVETLKRELADLFIPPDPRQTMRMTGDEMRALAKDLNGGVRPSEVILMRHLREAVERANMAVYGYTLHRPQEAMGAGSTVTMALIKGKRAYVVNVGDSRTYLLRRDRLIQLTRDHSVVAELIAAGKVTVQESFTHPQSGLITRCLGCIEQIEVDIEPVILEADDYLVLCSDGLWEMLRDPKLITRIIQSAADVEIAAQRLVEAANHAGGTDNISVVLVHLVKEPDIPT